MKKPYFVCRLGAAALIAATLCACAPNPDREIISNKGDGAFESNATATAPEHHDPDVTQPVAWSDSFSSTDGSVSIQISVDQSLTAADMPVVQVKPHFLTAEDAKRVAYAIFGDTEYREADEKPIPVYSKSQLQARIDRWSAYTSKEALRELYRPGMVSTALTAVKSTITEYMAELATAPDQDPRPLCQWEFKKWSYYSSTEEELKGMDLSNDNDRISTELNWNGIHYFYSVSIRDKDDFKISNIYADAYDGNSPWGIDGRIFRAKLCRTDPPTQEQLTAIQEKAADILAKLELGDWKVDRCVVQESNEAGTPEYVVYVDAVPVLNGMPAIRFPQYSSLKEEGEYAPRLYLTDANFRFAPNGELMRFNLFTPLDVEAVINDNVALLSVEELQERAKSYFVHSDKYTYGLNKTVLNSKKYDFVCNVTVDSLELNLCRLKKRNTEESYYYAPCLALIGTVQYLDKNTNLVYYESEQPQRLLTLNCVDGTIVNNTNT